MQYLTQAAVILPSSEMAVLRFFAETAASLSARFMRMIGCTQQARSRRLLLASAQQQKTSGLNVCQRSVADPTPGVYYKTELPVGRRRWRIGGRRERRVMKLVTEFYG